MHVCVFCRCELYVGGTDLGSMETSVGIFMNCGFEYCFRFNCKSVIDLIVSFCFTENVKLFYCIHHFTVISYVNHFHNVFHWASGVSIFQELLSEF